MTKKFARHDDEDVGACLSLEELVRYVEERLSVEQRAIVESHLKDCTLCMDAVEGLRAYEGEQTFRGMVLEIRERIHPRRRGQIRGMRMWYAIAAVLMLVTVSVFSYFYFNKPTPNEEVFVEYFSPYPSTRPETRDPVTKPRELMEMALFDYERREFDSAMRRFKSVLAEEPENVTAQFFLGNLYLLQKAPKPAIVCFEKVLHAESSTLSAPAKWYLALAYLLMNDSPNCRAIASTLSSTPGFYQNKAHTLIERIDSRQ